MIRWLLARFLGERVAERVSPWLVLVALLGAAYVLGGIFHAQLKLQDWLFWRYARIWLCCLLFCLACLSSGNWLVSRLSTDEEKGLGHFTLSFATGVFAFASLMTLLGFLGLLGRVAFVLVPLALVALGARDGWRELRRLVERAREAPGWLRASPYEVLAFCLGALALAVLYLAVLVPENTNYDSRWYHLGLAEHYAAAGGIVRSPEGAVPATIPHLASLLYTWAFCMPWVQLFDRVELAAHLEFVIFALSLPGVVALVRYLVPGAGARGAWVAMFVFPGVMLYDASLHGAADHIAAMWTVPTYLAFARAFKELRPRSCLLLAVQISGLMLCKYTSIMAVLGPLLVLTGRVLQLTFRQVREKPRRLQALAGFGTLAGSGLVLTASHWLKNLIWYGDPAYPLLHRVFTPRPWNIDGSFILDVYRADGFVAVGTTSEKLTNTVKSLWNYSYELYTWGNFHGTIPTFGSLFTFGLVALFFLPGTKRIWPIVLMAHLGIALWYWFFHFERYLQVLVPWMAAVVAAIAILAWRSGWAARVGVIVLGGLQIVWGADMIFWPMHQMTARSGIGLANEFFAKGYGANGAARTKPFDDFAALGRLVPKNSTVLVHHEHLHTGLGTKVVTDALRIQYGINYGELGSPRAVHDLLRAYGVTHVVWQPKLAYGEESVAGDLIFHVYARSWKTVGAYGGRTIAALPAAPPPGRATSALVHLCNGTYPAGVYEISDLRVSPYPLAGTVKRYPAPRKVVGEEAAGPYGYAIIDKACPHVPKLRGYEHVATMGSIQYFAGP